MTKRRPKNHKPTGLNKSLGNSLANSQARIRVAHKLADDNDDMINAALLDEAKEVALQSKTFESNIEELFAKAELSGLNFDAERERMQIVDKESTIVRTRVDLKTYHELQSTYGDRLKIPRRPEKHLYTTPEELRELENETFLKWRNGLSDLEGVDGVVLTPFERNPDIWRELWRVVERSDLVVQIVDSRNPLLFRSADLEDLVINVDPAKKNLLLVNKADLLLPQQQEAWENYFKENGIDAIFWSALDVLEKVEEKKEETDLKEEESEEDVDESEEESTGSPSHPTESPSPSTRIITSRDDLLIVLKERAGPVGIGMKPAVVGFVGYPNVGKSSTINKLIGTKKVTVSSTPGKTKRLQTINVDEQLTLCDCPGLVMPSFSFDKNEMFLNGIMPIEQMRDHLGPTDLLMTRVPSEWIASRYSVSLPPGPNTPHSLLTAIAFMRGFMSSSGIPDCSRAARLVLKDVVVGNLLWVSAPPSIEQASHKEFDGVLFPSVEEEKKKGAVQLEMLQRKRLIDSAGITDKRCDADFFDGAGSKAHIIFNHPGVPSMAGARASTKKHFKKKDKLRRIHADLY